MSINCACYPSVTDHLARNKYADETQDVARWARDIRLQCPEISRDEAIRIAEKWAREVHH